jgi:hypothetical protein
VAREDALDLMAQIAFHLRHEAGEANRGAVTKLRRCLVHSSERRPERFESTDALPASGEFERICGRPPTNRLRRDLVQASAQPVGHSRILTHPYR